ncbi:cell adhesion molecule-related/down-regulated by oncogenes-like [Mercenaria mercenaria]|uniref:cell adhesion molecule-related/down-regulated by oncogenes-like n=1 Tax=Mercenaria mercenaria TaxID=6596 RepID=UPI00234F546C|nr:cell adhesion molecule-related/down-regulated by oncogenes-like [Mercenaria mercenaria]
MLPCILPPQLSENNTVYWNFGKKTLSEGDNITIRSNEDRFSLYRPYNSDWYLRISPAEMGDEGIYQCHVEDAFTSTVKLLVESPPVVTGYLANKIYLQVCNTARVTLYCNVTGRPPPTIKWYKRISKEKLKYLDLNTESIFIPDVGHSNAGIYLCQVSNKHGQTGMEFHITVVDLVEELNTASGPQVPYQSGHSPVLGSAIRAGCADKHILYFHSFVVAIWTTRAFVYSL